MHDCAKNLGQYVLLTHLKAALTKKGVHTIPTDWPSFSGKYFPADLTSRMFSIIISRVVNSVTLMSIAFAQVIN